MKTLRLLWVFYMGFAFVSWLITLGCATILYTHGMATFMAIFWFKVITICIFAYSVSRTKKNTFYYYKNLGISRRKIWISTLGFDFVLFLLAMTLTIKNV